MAQLKEKLKNHCMEGRLSRIVLVVILLTNAILMKLSSRRLAPNFATIGLRTPNYVLDEEPSLLCTQNPFVGALNESLETADNRATDWLENIEEAYKKSESAGNGHGRFFPFEPTVTCKDISCVGGKCKADTSKMVCGLDHLVNRFCVIYSIGGNNQWEFELESLKRTKCEIHTFDCTGDISRFSKPESDRLFFHHVCLGTKHQAAPAVEDGVESSQYIKRGETWTLAEMKEKLDHPQIDLLKVDIEGFEVPLLRSWQKRHSLPMQVLVEVHFKTYPQFVEELRSRNTTYRYVHREEFMSPRELVALQEHLLHIGYTTVIRDDNHACGHCTELTLLRTAHCSTDK